MIIYYIINCRCGNGYSGKLCDTVNKAGNISVNSFLLSAIIFISLFINCDYILKKHGDEIVVNKLKYVLQIKNVLVYIVVNLI